MSARGAFGLLAACGGALWLAGCSSTMPAPVIDRSPTPAAAAAAPAATTPAVSARDFYTVKKGDTLYSIALDHGQDYRDLAAWNSLESVNVIKVGQLLRITPPEPPKPLGAVAEVRPVAPPAAVETSTGRGAAPGSTTYKREPKGGKVPYSEQALAAARNQGTAVPPPAAATSPTAASAVPMLPSKPEAAPAAATAGPPTAVSNEEGIDWSWPVNGKVLGGFSETASKGIDIAGKHGEAVHAAAGGRVVYAGEGLRGYGRLVIIKHDGAYLSAYAHNNLILVKEGQNIARGQKIAEVGNTDADQPKLHFEIRRQGKPVDPLKYLPAR